MADTILLFDVDGTLISSAGAGRRALERLFAEHLGSQDAFAGIPFAGMTDPAILRAGLRALGAPDQPERLAALLPPYLEILQDEVDRTDGFRVHAGVAEVLDWFASAPGVAVGLGTGNIEAGARIKLRRVGLDTRFGFGGYGSDAEERGAILRIGAARGAAALGRDLARCRVIVIGDTPRDVEAAREIGAACVAVGTGPFPVAELERQGATEAVPTMDRSRVLRAAAGRGASDETAAERGP